MPGALFIAASALTAAGGLVWIGYELRGDGGSARARCRGCAYDMAAVNGLTCPECGRPHEQASSLRYTRRSRTRMAASVLLTLASFAGAAWPWYSGGNPWSLTPTRVLIALWPVAEKLEWSAATHMETELLTRPLTGSEARALCRELIGIWNDGRENSSDDIAEMVLLGLAQREDGLIRWEQDRHPSVSALASEEDDDHFFTKLGAEGAEFVPGLVQAARRGWERYDGPITLLSLLSKECPQARDGLISLFDDYESICAEALAARAGDAGVTRVLDAIASGSMGGKEIGEALRVLENSEVRDPRAVQILLGLLAGGSYDDVSRLTELLRRLGVDREQVLTARDAILKAALRDKMDEPRTTFSALGTLVGALRVEDLSQAVPLLESRDPAQRARAAALLVLTSDAPDLSDVLAGTLEGGSEFVRTVVYDAARAARSRDPRLLDAARRDSLAADDARALCAREYLAAALEPSELVAFWIENLKHEDWKVREVACESVRSLGAHAGAALPALEELANDPQPWVVKAAARASRDLTRRSPPGADELLRDELDAASRWSRPLAPTFAKFFDSPDDRLQCLAATHIDDLLSAKEALTPEIYLKSRLTVEGGAALILRLVELDRQDLASDVIATLAPWTSGRARAISEAISRLTPVQADSLRDPLARRLRRMENPERASEIIQAVEAVGTAPR